MSLSKQQNCQLCPFFDGSNLKYDDADERLCGCCDSFVRRTSRRLSVCLCVCVYLPVHPGDNESQGDATVSSLGTNLNITRSLFDTVALAKLDMNRWCSTVTQ